MTVQELIQNYSIRYLYHFTDPANLSSIRKHGLFSMEKLKAQEITTHSGGNDWSQEADERQDLHRYVHLSFVDDPPMKYQLEQEGRTFRVLCIDSQVMSLPGVVYTADVANKTDVAPLNLTALAEEIDFKLMEQYVNGQYTDWKSPKIQAIKKAEILVPDCIPISCITSGLA